MPTFAPALPSLSPHLCQAVPSQPQRNSSQLTPHPPGGTMPSPYTTSGMHGKRRTMLTRAQHYCMVYSSKLHALGSMAGDDENGSSVHGLSIDFFGCGLVNLEFLNMLTTLHWTALAGTLGRWSGFRGRAFLRRTTAWGVLHNPPPFFVGQNF